VQLRRALFKRLPATVRLKCSFFIYKESPFFQVQHLHNFNEFETINESEKKGFFAGMWSILTLGGYVTSKLKNAFGLKSLLIKNKLNGIEEILKKGLEHLTAVFPSQRVIQSVVDKSESLRKAKEQSQASKKNDVGINTSQALSQLMFEIEKAILIYEDDKDLNLMKEEVEGLCQSVVNNEKVSIPNVETFKATIKSRTKDLKLNKKLVQELTQKLPRYDLKNLSLEASVLIRNSDGSKDQRLTVLFQKRKNSIYSKYEKYYDFDELNN